MKKKLLYMVCSLCVFVLGLTLFFGLNQSSSTKVIKKQKICLNMIVKNEASVIEQCLNSVKGLVDTWVIVDTGSTDGTQSVIAKCMKGIPGSLHERSWVNFEHNRNEALLLAKDKADYILVIDADEKLIFSSDFKLPDMTKDMYSIQVKQKDASDSVKWFLLKNDLDWKWKGVLHETPVCKEEKTREMITGVLNYSDTSLGARSRDLDKYKKDAAILTKALESEPANSRYQFHLANCYLMDNDLLPALENYKKRASMAEDDHAEYFFSQLMMARLKAHFHVDYDEVVKDFKEAIRRNPSRAEPIYYLGDYYLQNEQPQLAYELLSKCPDEFPLDEIFYNEMAINNWRLSFLQVKVCYALQKYSEMRTATKKVLSGKEVPEDVMEEAHRNLTVLNGMLGH